MPAAKAKTSSQRPSTEASKAYDSATAAQLADPLWRLRNLYVIRNEAGKPEPFSPNAEQEEVLLAIYVDGNLCIVIPKARQIGFSTLMALICLDSILFGSSIQCSLVDLTAGNAKKKLTDKILFAFDRLPPDLRACYVERTRNVQQGEFAISCIHSEDPNAVATMFADDKQRGGTNQLLWISEWAEVSVTHPAKSQEILLGAWPTGEQGLRIIETTWHGGKRGHVWPIVRRGLETPANRRTPTTPRVMFFPWFRKSTYARPGEAEEIKEGTARYFREKQAKLGLTFTIPQQLWYQDQAETLGIFVKGQYPTDIDECFEAPVKGAIWAQAIANARSEGRITPLPANYTLEVDTFWDLGAPDNTATLYIQHQAGERHMIDFDFAESFTLPERVRHMKRKQDEGYHYGTHYLPHDGAHRQKNGISFQAEFAAELAKQGVGGRVVGLKSTTDKWLSINHSTGMIKHARIDAEKCKKWVEAAELYRRKPDPNDDERFLDEVYSDWTNHCCDSFRTMAEAALAGHLPSTSNGIMTNTYFDSIQLSEAIKALTANVPTIWELDYQGETFRQLTARRSESGWLRIWNTPEVGQSYLVSLVNGALGVWRQAGWDHFKGDIPLKLVAASIDNAGVHATHITEWAAALSAHYGNAPIAVDVESMPGVVDRLKALGAGVVSRRQSADRRRVGQDTILKHPGFEINPEVRIECYTIMQQVWRDGQVEIFDPMILKQMGGIITGEGDTPDLMPGFNENWVKMAALGIWQIGQASPCFFRSSGPSDRNRASADSGRVVKRRGKLC